MSSNGHQANTVDSTLPAGRVSEQVAGEFHGLGDGFARLGETLRQHADQVAVLVNRASAAEERCLALDQRLEEMAQENTTLRDQLGQVNARVADFQETGARHLAEMQALTEDYARRVAASEQTSEAMQIRVAELGSQLEERDHTIGELRKHAVAQDEHVAQLHQRAEATAAIAALAAESVQNTTRFLGELSALHGGDGQPLKQTLVAAPKEEVADTMPASELASTFKRALVAAPKEAEPAQVAVAATSPGNVVGGPRQTHNWYALGRKAR